MVQNNNVSPSTPASSGWAVFRQRAVITTLFLGFSSGLPLALTAGTLSFWLKERGVDLATIGLFANVGLPYAFKFLWSPLVDRLPLPILTKIMGQRRGWLVFTQIWVALMMVGLAMVVPSGDMALTALLALGLATASATQDIAIDAFRVEISTPEQLGAGAAAVQYGYRVAMLTSGAGALFLAEYWGWELAYLVMAGLMVIGLVTVLITPEPKREIVVANNPQQWLKSAVLDPIADFVKRDQWVMLLLFVLFFKFGDAFAGVMATPFYQDIGFTKPEVATISKGFGLIATFVGLALGGYLVARFGFIKALWVGGILQMASNLTYVVQAEVGHDVQMLAVTIGVENLAGGLGSAAFVGYISMLCNRQYTATQYALLSSIAVVGRTVLSSFGGFAAADLGWSWFFVLSTLVAIPGLIFLFLITKRQPGTLDGSEEA